MQTGDTGEDEEIAHDTCPMSGPINLWSHWRVTCEELSPDLTVWLVSDGGDVKVPARSHEHALLLREAMQAAEYHTAVVPSARWLSTLRGWALALLRWLNTKDRPHRRPE